LPQGRNRTTDKTLQRRYLEFVQLADGATDFITKTTQTSLSIKSLKADSLFTIRAISPSEPHGDKVSKLPIIWLL
jgi:hypothetical protein